MSRMMNLARVMIVGALVLVLAGSGMSQAKPLRVAIVGMVHGHVEGFLGPALKRSDIQVVGIAEPDRALEEKYAGRFGLDRKLLYIDLEQMLAAVKISSNRQNRGVEVSSAECGDGLPSPSV